MSEEKQEGSWLFWIIAFLVIAFFIYVWLNRDEKDEKKSQEQAVNSLREVGAKIDNMRDKAQSVLHATEERIAKASANLSSQVAQAVQELEEEAFDAKEEDVAEEEADEDVVVDDLTRIEGIGPKYREALLNAGVTTFAQIASKTEEELVEIVRDAGMRRPPSLRTWAEQAKLASNNDWDALEIGRAHV